MDFEDFSNLKNKKRYASYMEAVLFGLLSLGMITYNWLIFVIVALVLIITNLYLHSIYADYGFYARFDNTQNTIFKFDNNQFALLLFSSQMTDAQLGLADTLTSMNTKYLRLVNQYNKVIAKYNVLADSINELENLSKEPIGKEVTVANLKPELDTIKEILKNVEENQTEKKTDSDSKR